MRSDGSPAKPPEKERHPAGAGKAKPGQTHSRGCGQVNMDTLAELEQQVRGCTDCPLHAGRTHAVPGEGPPDAELLFIGEGPGAQEDRQGRPFVGPAGSFLDDLLQSIGMSREQVYIANMVKCRPPNNRDPMSGEIAACRKYLDRQIELIDPLLIVTLGRFSMARFLPGQSISRVRGRLRQVDGRRIFPIMHPAAGLRRQEMRAAIEEDFGRIPALLDVLRMQAEPPPPGMASAVSASASSPTALREPEAAYEPEPAPSLWDAPAASPSVSSSPTGSEATDTGSDRRDVGDDANAAGDTNAGGGESDGDGNVANAAVNKDAGDDANFAGTGNRDTGDDTNAAVNTDAGDVANFAVAGNRDAGDGRNDTNIADDTDGGDDSDVADAGDTAAGDGGDDSGVADAGDTAADVGGDNGGTPPAKPQPPTPPAPPPAAAPAPEPPPGQVRMF